MKQTLKKSVVEAGVVGIFCIISAVLLSLFGLSEKVEQQLNKHSHMVLDEILFISLLISLSSIIILGLNYRRLFHEIKLRKEAEAEVSVLRHSNNARAAEIMLALDEGEFEVYYQPILELQTERIVAFEALVRWQHPTFGLLSPNSFMPFIEERELIVPLTKFMLMSVAQQITKWKRAFPDASLPTVSINFSWQHNLYSEPIQDVKAILAEFEDFVPQYLCIELTESTAAQNIEQAIELTKQFRELGIAVSIDDFGTGYSSLSYLGDIPATSVKIDRSFIKRMLEEAKSDILVRSIIKMAHELNLKVVAEGIETESQMLHLVNLGCEYGQGYYFARPLPIDKAQEMIAFQINESHRATYPRTAIDYLIDIA